MEHVSKSGWAIVAALALAGCNGEFSTARNGPGQDIAVDTVQKDIPKPPRSAQTAEQFDTTTKAQRSQAAKDASPAQSERKLGATVGSLGNPAAPGFWIKTPLVSKPGRGRVEYPATGKSVAVDLIPIDGPKTAGSRVSLAAMRLLGAPLTGLPDLIVYAK